ncbi:MAG: hypothetical protein OIN66_09470 [Candidatus Methanoperedens sp.]|nr:hypothetical protein [Candidatus Methanoperedens sp.]
MRNMKEDEIKRVYSEATFERGLKYFWTTLAASVHAPMERTANMALQCCSNTLMETTWMGMRS